MPRPLELEEWGLQREWGLLGGWGLPRPLETYRQYINTET
jgi:hypothetical protein